MNTQCNASVAEDISHLSPQELIHAYLPLVKSVANSVLARCPANVELDDLINVGVIGLMDAAERYSPAYGKPFRFYAELRVRGEILDELRSHDWLPRATRKKLTLIERKRLELEKQLGPGVTDSAMAEALGLDLEKYQQVSGRAPAGSFLSIEDLGVQEEEQKDLYEVVKGDSMDPDAMLRVREMEETITNAIRALPHREKLMISLYYYQELSLREIGCVFGVTESRVSQMHAKALARLRRSMLRARMEHT
jgi:RNA polymerase sigma factor for flagellar operon FliA